MMLKVLCVDFHFTPSIDGYTELSDSIKSQIRRAKTDSWARLDQYCQHYLLGVT